MWDSVAAAREASDPPAYFFTTLAEHLRRRGVDLVEELRMVRVSPSCPSVSPQAVGLMEPELEPEGPELDPSEAKTF